MISASQPPAASHLPTEKESGDQHIPSIDKTCALCGGYSCDEVTGSVSLPHHMADCPMAKNKLQLLSALQSIHNALSGHPIPELTQSPLLQRLLIRKALIEVYLHSKRAYFAMDGFDVVEYRLSVSPPTSSMSRPSQVLREHPQPVSSSRRDTRPPNKRRIFRSKQYDGRPTQDYDGRNSGDTQNLEISYNNSQVPTNDFAMSFQALLKDATTTSGISPSISGYSTTSTFNAATSLQSQPQHANARVDMDWAGLLSTPGDDPTLMAGLIDCDDKGDLLLPPAKTFEVEAPQQLSTRRASSRPSSVNSSMPPSISNTDALDAILDDMEDQPGSMFGDDYASFLKSLNVRRDNASTRKLLDEEDDDCIVELDQVEPIEEYLESEISSEEIDDLCDDDDFVPVSTFTASNSSMADVVTQEFVDRLHSQMNDNFQLVVQNLLISRELGPIGSVRTMDYWMDALNELTELYGGRSDLIIDELPMVPLVLAQLDNMPICPLFGPNLRKKRSKRMRVKLPTSMTSILNRFKTFKRQLLPDLHPFVANHRKFVECEDNLLFIGLWHYCDGLWAEIGAAVLPHRSVQSIATRYKNLSCRRSNNEQFKRFHLTSQKHMSTQQRDRLKEMVMQSPANLYAAGRELGRTPGQLRMAFLFMADTLGRKPFRFLLKKASGADDDEEDVADEADVEMD